MKRVLLMITLLMVLAFLPACQDPEAGKNPFITPEVEKVLETMPLAFREKLSLPTYLPFQPESVTASFDTSSPKMKRYEQIFVENKDHRVILVMGENAVAFADREKIRLKNGLDVYYEQKGILYCSDEKRNIHYILSTIDHSSDRRYRLTKEELLKIAESLQPVEPL